MNTEQIRMLNDQYIINTYGPRKLALTRGEGVTLWDADGKEYLDCFAGIAVANLGHCHPAVTEAICQQAQKLVHVSNLYYIEPQVHLGQMLCHHSFADRWFFCNGGAEANEAAIKLARRYWSQKDQSRPVIVTADQSFHGRTMATIAATGQAKYRQGFEPMPGGFRYVPFDDLEAIEEALRDEAVGAVLLEPIQGEGGVRVPEPGYIKQVRQLCNAKDVLLILDEVQTGLGRTGTLFAHEADRIQPDIMTLAKGLANGVPIGAMGCTAEVAQGFSVGSHACTFGGNPLSSAAACATLEVIADSAFLARVEATGAHFMARLREAAAGCGALVEVRGRGLMIGIEFSENVAPLVDAMREGGVICGPAGPTVLRFVPPLIITKDQVDRAVSIFAASLKELGW
ncbi:MAG: aspartate aminotransferase family protein [Candidatus Hydrogenedentota bacterium]